ncbi:unnamed protein product, partial [Mesorhabditis spiculigera]
MWEEVWLAVGIVLAATAAVLGFRKLLEKRAGKSFNNETIIAKSGHMWEQVQEFDGSPFCSTCERRLARGYRCEYCNMMVDEVKCARSISAVKCCKANAEVTSDDLIKHHWVHGNLLGDAFCSVCGDECGQDIGLSDYRCSWCARNAHSSCRAELEEVCDFGELKQSVVPPNKVTLRKAGSRGVKQMVIDGIIRPDAPPDWRPVFILVNPKSGSGAGIKVASAFRLFLHPIQVIDVTKSHMKAVLRWLDERPDIEARILIAGGDGTISFVLNDIDELENRPPVAVLPLGTGNDLSRVLGLLNKFLFFTFGTKDVFERACSGLESKIELTVDGKVVELPEIEGLIFLNIPCWGAGVEPWSMEPNEEMPQSCSDGRFEIFAVRSSFHIAQLQISGRRPPAVELLEGLAGSEGDLSGPPLAKKLSESVESLVEESGCKVENARAVRLREAIMRGHWNEALSVLEKSYQFLSPHELETAKLIILEEKFFELLSKGENTLAMKLMREEYPNKRSLRTRRTELVGMLFADANELGKHPEIKKFDSRDAHWRRRLAIRVQKQLDPAYMLPCKRLEQLTDQAFKYQVGKCRLHFDGDHVKMADDSIFRNHDCTEANKPLFKAHQILKKHTSEIYVVEFSPDGSKVASGSKNGEVIIWQVDQRSRKLGDPVLIRHNMDLHADDDLDHGTLSMWSADSAKPVAKLDDIHRGVVNSLRVFTANLIHCADSRRARPQRAAHLSANGVGGHRSTPIPQLDSGHKKKPVNQLDYLRLQAVARARGLIFSNPGYAI